MWNAILRLFGLDKESVLKRDGLKKCKAALMSAIDDLRLEQNERNQLEAIIKAHGLCKSDLIACQRAAFQLAFDKATSDDRLTDDEHEQLNEIVEYFGVNSTELGIDQAKFNRTRMLAELEQGRIPVMPNDPTGIILKDGEHLHYAFGAVLVKRKRQVERVNYSGVTASIRIAKGIRYRVGSIKPQVISREVYAQEDAGAFYVTNMRVGFKGGRKAIDVPISKITAYEVSEGILHIFKAGKESPYMLYLTEYDVTMSLLSNVLEAA